MNTEARVVSRPDETAGLSEQDRTPRRAGGAVSEIAGGYVLACNVDSPSWAVQLVFGKYETGTFSRYFMPDDARALAAALIRAADHYDAETARLAALAVQP